MRPADIGLAIARRGRVHQRGRLLGFPARTVRTCAELRRTPPGHGTQDRVGVPRLGEFTREAIPERVRHEVWRRDRGRCVDCGARERLEFDHIIPISRGGSNTARNIELRMRGMQPPQECDYLTTSATSWFEALAPSRCSDRHGSQATQGVNRRPWVLAHASSLYLSVEHTLT